MGYVGPSCIPGVGLVPELEESEGYMGRFKLLSPDALWVGLGFWTSSDLAFLLIFSALSLDRGVFPGASFLLFSVGLDVDVFLSSLPVVSVDVCWLVVPLSAESVDECWFLGSLLD